MATRTSSPLKQRTRPWMLAAAMLATIVGIATAGVLEERGEAARARADMIREQVLLAEVLAAEFAAELAGRDGEGPPASEFVLEGPRWRIGGPGLAAVMLEPRSFLLGDRLFESGDHRLLIAASGAPGLWTTDGRPVDLPRVGEAIADDEVWTTLEPNEAAALGLPAELALAGLARVDSKRLGSWTVVVVRSAQLLRGRERRRARRLIGGGALVGLVVLGFGLVAFRTQRQELALAQALAREELRTQMAEQLARESRAATMLTFAAGMAHEVSTPLGVIGMRAEQIAGQAEGERERRAAQAIGEQVVRVRELMRRFLLIARGGAPLRERFPAREVIAEAAARVQHRFDRAQVRLTCEPPTDGPWLHGDARLLEHALTNLLINACDASPEGGEVVLRADADGGPHELTIAVQDRGPGVDPAQAARILEPFVSTKQGGEGSGVGLAIANEVVRMHRGTLTLAARPGGGTCAVIKLPAEHAAPSELSDAHPPGR